MSEEKRVFFRFDVEVAYYLESQDENRHCLHIQKEELFDYSDQQKVEKINRLLQALLSQTKYVENGGATLFTQLNDKLEVMIWLLEQIMQGGDVFEHSDYQHKLQTNRLLHLPDTDRSSKIFPLLEGYFNRVEQYVFELVDVVEKSVKGKVFMYKKPSPNPFAHDSYINGLDRAAKEGNWLAKVIVLLVEKLNLYESILEGLKRSYEALSHHEQWPRDQVNLAAGGFSVSQEKVYRPGDKICSLFKLDDEFVFARATCVYQKQGGVALPKRTAFQFEEIDAEDEAHIVRYLSSKELESRDAM